MAEVPLSREEALDLLQKWAEENRIIDVSVVADGVVVRFPTRLDDVNPGAVRLSLTKSTFSYGAHTRVSISLLDCTFEYSDADQYRGSVATTHFLKPSRSCGEGNSCPVTAFSVCIFSSY